MEAILASDGPETSSASVGEVAGLDLPPTPAEVDGVKRKFRVAYLLSRSTSGDWRWPGAPWLRPRRPPSTRRNRLSRGQA